MARKLSSLGSETEQLEFKTSTGELKEAVISIAAILNKHGMGKLYFGVKNDGTVVGQEINDTTLRAVSQAISNHLRPAIYPTIVKKQIGRRKVVLVEFEGNQQPYLAYNIPRIRVADQDLVMEQPKYEKLLRQRDNIIYSWESQRSKYKISDIDPKILNNYLQKAKEVGRITFDNEQPEEVLTKLELTDGEWLLNAGAALFVSSGINELQMAKFASDERLTFTDIRRNTGSILELADMAVQYIIDAMDWRVEFDGKLERKEIPEIPLDAIREAVINSFGHRLIESGQSVEVSIFRSFIEIYNSGSFPDGLTPEMFIKESRKPIRRNPLITRILYYSKDMESFATGLKRIQVACNKAGCKVEFYGDDYGFTVRFYRHCGDSWATATYIKRGTQSNLIGTQLLDNGTQSDVNGTQSPEIGTQSPEIGTQSDVNGTHSTENGTQSDDNGTQSNDNGTQSNEIGTQSNEIGTQSNEIGTQSNEIDTQSDVNGTQSNEIGTHRHKIEVYKTQIIVLIKENNKLTRKQIASKLSISIRTVQRIIDSMDELEYIGSGRGGQWVIKEK
jgi:ATP-dependent DNA helicase RecG